MGNMREIKFRAFYKGDVEEWESEGNARMIYDIQDAYDGTGFDDPEGGFGWVSCFSDFMMDEKISVMQYTGLKDKNGTEIYEGDVVEVIHEDGFKTIGQVVWGLDSHRYGNYPAFTIPEFESDLNSFAEIYDSGYYEIEVIGNIYEHKHLLEREK